MGTGSGALRWLIVQGVVMARADDYRRYASECLALAQRAKTAGDRARLLEMAHAWNQMAAKAAEHEQSQKPSAGDAER